MDRGQFDAMIRLIAAQRSRRAAIAVLLTGVLTSLFDPAATASRKRNTNHRDHHRGDHGRRGGAAGGASPRDGKHKRGNTKRNKGRTAKQRPSPTQAEAANACCSRSCAPGPGQDLKNCCFEGQNLAGANFSRSNLAGASFRGATLTGANFNNANLSKTCLIDADISGATFSSANLSGAVFCRTRTGPGSFNNSGCGQGTPCCAACDAQHPCGADQVCCGGRCLSGNCCDTGVQSTCAAGEICCGNRCVAGACCQASECANEVCQRRACQANQCVYTPVVGTPGPLCPAPRVCCVDTGGNPVCCQAGVTACLPSGICGCGSDTNCAADQRCCGGECIARTICCEGNNGEGCAGAQHCCVIDGTGVCRECCDAAQCPDEICENKSCGNENICVYTAVFGRSGPDCETVCCRDANGNPQCCDTGISVCTASGRCQCASGEDCTADQICCNSACIANTQCCNGDPGTCPAPDACQIRACANGACQPRDISGGSCPITGGGTGVCRDGRCVCPAPRITCNNVCCSDGVTQCASDGTCPQVCDVCANGCAYTTVAAAVTASTAGSTIHICAGTYVTLNVRIDKNLTIVGAGSGAGGTTLDGQRTNRIFTIADGITVTIRDLSMTKGLGTQQDNAGAAILVRFDASLTLDRVEVTDSTNPSGFGIGAIAVAPRSSLLLKESRVANNLNFSFGGGINVNNDATVTVEASRIDGNSAGLGGGIWINDSGTVNLDSASIVTANHAQNPSRLSGGGIYNKGRVNGATTTNVTGNTRGNPPIPDDCANAPRIPGSGFGTGCPA